MLSEEAKIVGLDIEGAVLKPMLVRARGMPIKSEAERENKENGEGNPYEAPVPDFPLHQRTLL